MLAKANCRQNHEIAFPVNAIAANRLGATQQEKYGLEILKRGAATVGGAEKARKTLLQGNARQKLAIRKGLFVKAATPDHLLCLLGMESVIKLNWQGRVRALANEEWGAKGQVLEATLNEYRSEFPDIMQEVCGETLV